MILHMLPQEECSTSFGGAFQPAAHFRPIIDDVYRQLQERWVLVRCCGVGAHAAELGL